MLIRRYVFRRWAEYLRDVIQPKLDQFEAMEAAGRAWSMPTHFTPASDNDAAVVGILTDQPAEMAPVKRGPGRPRKTPVEAA